MYLAATNKIQDLLSWPFCQLGSCYLPFNKDVNKRFHPHPNLFASNIIINNIVINNTLIIIIFLLLINNNMLRMTMIILMIQVGLQRCTLSSSRCQKLPTALLYWLFAIQ